MFTFQNLTIMTIMNSQIANMIINPKKGFLRPKNAGDQIILKKRWIKNRRTLLFAALFFFLQFRYRETPIKRYRVNQAGPNNQLGGEKEGLFNVLYQVGIEETVKKDPIIPASWGSSKDNNSFIILL